MTNGEKHKTAKERERAFDRFCKSNSTDCGMCMPDCKLFYLHDDNKDYCAHCEFHWLDLEAEEEKPLPCPFCGNEMDVSTSNCAILCVCGYSSPIDRNLSKVIAAHNRVAKAVKQSEEATNGND